MKFVFALFWLIMLQAFAYYNDYMYNWNYESADQHDICHVIKVVFTYRTQKNTTKQQFLFLNLKNMKLSKY